LSYYWIRFAGHAPGTVRAKDVAEAIELGKSITGVEVASIDILPYPASPQLNECDCPSFCYTPEQCKGNTCCRKNYACTE
jgi:hypothetical protein